MGARERRRGFLPVARSRRLHARSRVMRVAQGAVSVGKVLLRRSERTRTTRCVLRDLSDQRRLVMRTNHGRKRVGREILRLRLKDDKKENKNTSSLAVAALIASAMAEFAVWVML